MKRGSSPDSVGYSETTRLKSTAKSIKPAVLVAIALFSGKLHGESGLDTDGDGWSPDDGDCNDADANIYPGKVIVDSDYDDGDDDNCDSSDAPIIETMSVSPDEIEIGNSIDLNVETKDEETRTDDLIINWVIEDTSDTTIDSFSGSSNTYEPEEQGTYTITCTVTDENGNESSDKETIIVTDDSTTYPELPTTDGEVPDGTYYEDSENPERGSITLAKVSIVDGFIILTGYGSSFSATSYPAIDYSAPDAGVSGDTTDDWVGEGVLGFMAANADDYPFADTEDTTKMFWVRQTAGTLTANGTYTNSDGSLELEESLNGNDEEKFADIIDDPDVIDTGDADTDTDSNTDSDSDTDTDTDTGTPTEGCPGCATENGINGSFAVGALAMAAMAARRRRK